MHKIRVRLQNLKPGFKTQTRITHVIKRTQSFNCHHELYIVWKRLIELKGVKFFNLRRLVSSVGRGQVCWAGGRGFKPWPDQHSESLNNWEESVAFVIWTSKNG